ncbi:SLAM family member 6 [Carlito syrichta]|uniref:SLAM family member 6 n=1 Tax=Carlito syrichta TaxID=1868482 RepID=A0A1U7TTA7_CARSF|nr:SLAM family member 6 [Carlito syrichta]
MAPTHQTTKALGPSFYEHNSPPPFNKSLGPGGVWSHYWHRTSFNTYNKEKVLAIECTGNVVSQNSSSTPLIINGVLGEVVTLPLKIPKGEIRSITWLMNGKQSIVFISLNEPSSPAIYVIDPTRKNRLSITQSHSLQLSNLMMTDEGPYNAQIATDISIVFYNYTLKIFRKLSNIQVTHHSQLFENRTCEIHLACSVENPNDDVSFRWQTSGNTLLSEPNLTISCDLRNSNEQKYICIAENPVSNLSFSVSAQRLCGDIKEDPYLPIQWVLPISFMICIVIPMSVYVYKKRKGSLPLSIQQTQGPAESTRNRECMLVSPGSNTVYAVVAHPSGATEIPTPIENNDSITIYSIINHSKESKPTFSRTTALDSVI